MIIILELVHILVTITMHGIEVNVLQRQKKLIVNDYN